MSPFTHTETHRGWRLFNVFQRVVLLTGALFGFYAVVTLQSQQDQANQNRVTAGEQRCNERRTDIHTIELNQGRVPPSMRSELADCEALLAEYREQAK